MAVYDPTLELLANVPTDHAVNLVVRHSKRYPILNLEDVAAAPLTPEGIRVAEEFGRVLVESYALGKLETSEINRCVDTAAAIARGARWKVNANPEPRLTYTYTDDIWHQRRVHLFRDNPMPEPVRDLVDYLWAFHPKKRKLNVFVTHDSVLGCLAGYLFKDMIDEDTWPHFLEGMAFWQENGKMFSAWRNQVIEIKERPCMDG